MIHKLRKKLKKANKSDTASSAQGQQPDPAQQDAQLVQRWFAVSWLVKLLIILVFMFVAACATLYYLAGTDKGTQYLLNVMSKQSGVQLGYRSGNLRDGLLLTTLNIKAGNTDVIVTDAEVKIGWRALFAKEAHFREARVGQVRVINHKPPEHKPFSFDTIKLPVNLRLSQVSVGYISYEQVTQNPIIIRDVKGQDLSWVNTNVQIGKAQLVYGNLLKVSDLVGNISLKDDYPLNATGVVDIYPLSRNYFAPIALAASGNLKQLQGKLSSQYNNAIIVGNITAQPVADNAPFNAQLQWQDVNLPYVSEQNIHLLAGQISAVGDATQVALTLDTKLTANDIPHGRYYGTASTDFSGLTIHKLTAELAAGELVSTGQIDWSQGVQVALNNRAEHFNLQALLPSGFVGYMPEQVTGNLQLAVDFQGQQLEAKVDFNRDQGEKIYLTAQRLEDKAPLVAQINWQNLQRDKLPNVGVLNSPAGQADIILNHQQLSITAKADINALNQAPKGNYTVKSHIDNVNHPRRIDINQLNYQGVAGQLQATGAIKLPASPNKHKQPITWQLEGNTTGFKPQAIYLQSPVSQVSGNLVASGSVLNNHYGVTLNRVDLLGDMPSRQVQLTGTGELQLELSPVQSTATQSNKTGLTFAGQFNGKFNTQGVPGGDLVVDVSGSPEQIHINQLHHTGDAGMLDATGKLTLTNGVTWQINSQLQQFNLGFFVPQLPSNITGVVNSTGSWQQNQQQIDISQLDLAGTLQNKPLAASGLANIRLALPKQLPTVNQFTQLNQHQLKHSLNQIVQQLQVHQLKLQWANNRMLLNGNKQQLDMDVDVSTLNQIHPALQGVVKGNMYVRLNPNSQLPTVLTHLQAKYIRLGNVYLAAGQLKGKLDNLGLNPSRVKFSVTNAEVMGKVFKQLTGEFVGTQAQHRLNISTITDNANIGFTLAGGLQAHNQWAGVLTNGHLTTKVVALMQKQPAQLLLDGKKSQLQLAAHCWQASDNTGNFCLTQDVKVTKTLGKLHASMRKLNAHVFKPFLPDDLAWMGYLNGDVKLGWQQGKPASVQAKLYTDDGSIGLTPQDPQDEAVTVAYKRISLIALSVTDGLKLRLDAKTRNGGNGYVDVVINPNASPKPISGALVLDNINLIIFKPFFPAMRTLAGQVSLAGGVGGTLNKPLFFGNLKLQQGRVALLDVPVDLKNINMKTQIRGQRATIKTTFNSGAGEGTLDGTVNWQQELKVKLQLVGKQLQITQPPVLFAEVSPNIEVKILPQSKRVAANGVVNIPSATIRPPAINGDMIKTSTDTVILDRRANVALDKLLATSRPWRVDTDMSVMLGADVYFRGFGAAIPLKGDIHIVQDGQGKLQGYGLIDIKQKTQVNAFGQSLDLNYAQLQFDGAVNKPLLDIEAEKDVQGQTVGVRVKGDPNNPNIVVFNNAGLTEQQALNALVTGRLNAASGTNAAGFRSEVDSTLAAAGLSYGLSGTRGLTNEVGRAFGLQSLTVDAAGSNDDTKVNITGYITPDLYIRYGIGVFTPVNKLSLRYQVSRRVYVEASSALEKAIDVFYNWKF